MCTVVIDTLDNIASLNVCYYFCNNEDDGRDNPSERILGVIATQLLRAHPELASLITNEFILPGLSSGLAQLRTLVPKFLELQRYTRIVIDGIDECSKSGQKSLLNELQSTCLGPKLHSKILISSRKEPTINAELGKKPNICLDENEKVEMDIRRYVNHKIQLVQSNFVGELEPEIFNQIATSIVDKADGKYSGLDHDVLFNNFKGCSYGLGWLPKNLNNASVEGILKSVLEVYLMDSKKRQSPGNPLRVF